MVETIQRGQNSYLNQAVINAVKFKLLRQEVVTYI